MPIQARATAAEAADAPAELWVEGYAVRFDSPTVLFKLDGQEYKEQICSGALDGADMGDVIFNYNHAGNVMARTRNNTLALTLDRQGLFIRARVDGTEAGRQLYEEIQGGYVDRMSFRFTIQEESFDFGEMQWNVRKIDRLFDVSAVDIPAFDDTSIGVASRKAEIDGMRKADLKAMRLRERINIMGMA